MPISAFPRILGSKLLHALRQSRTKIFGIYGARQVGKTTLVENVLARTRYKVLRINGDRLEHHAALSSRNFCQLHNLVAGYQVMFVDETQCIAEIGVNLKILKEQIPQLKIVITGSSSLDLSQSGERTINRKQVPISTVSIGVTRIKRSL